MTSRPKSPLPTPPAAPAEIAASAPSSDVALVHQITADGAVHVIRRRGNQLEAGAFSPLKEGVPIQGEVVRLRPRENCPLLCDVDVCYAPPAAVADKPSASPARRKGPAQVATDEYRDNWDSIWSAKKPKPSALN